MQSELSPGARKRPFPVGLSPMLLQAAKEPFVRDGWFFEPKLDGMRCIVYIRDGCARLYSKSGRELTDTFPNLAAELCGQVDCVLDGEIVAHSDDGSVSFERLGERWSLRKASEIAKADRINPVSFYAFDILHLGDLSLIYVGLSFRKALLAEHFKITEKAKRVDQFDDGIALFQACREQTFEGIVAKRAASSYQAGQRSPDWLKIKYSLIENFVIVGQREEDGYILAQGDRVVGCVNYGFTNAEREDLTTRLVILSEKIERKKKTISYEPTIAVRIEFMEWTSRRLLRYPVFRGFV